MVSKTEEAIIELATIGMSFGKDALQGVTYAFRLAHPPSADSVAVTTVKLLFGYSDTSSLALRWLPAQSVALDERRPSDSRRPFYTLVMVAITRLGVVERKH